MYTAEQRISLVESRIPVTLLLAIVLMAHGLRKKSLNNSGAIAAGITGLFTCSAGWVFFVVLMAFYLSSSRLTKYKSSIKKKIEGDAHLVGGQRNYIQVFSNSLTATVCCVLYLVYAHNPLSTFINSDYPLEAFLLCAIIGHYACCNGDTWASELGILNKSQPILITTLRNVPAGTNGGVSRLGIMASVGGGLFIGIFYYIASWMFGYLTLGDQYNHIYNQVGGPAQWPVILLATIAGLFGSLLDSFMGATVQYSGWDIKQNVVVSHPPAKHQPDRVVAHLCGIDLLDNHQVNFLSSMLTALASGLIGMYLF